MKVLCLYLVIYNSLIKTNFNLFQVHRSLSVCQGVILLVDSNDGVQAQTVANFYLAFVNDLVIIPVLNKIDLKNADPERVSKQLKSLFEINPDEILKVNLFIY